MDKQRIVDFQWMFDLNNMDKKPGIRVADDQLETLISLVKFFEASPESYRIINEMRGAAAQKGEFIIEGTNVYYKFNSSGKHSGHRALKPNDL